MRLNRDFRELLESFAGRDVRYLVIGGWALAAHGHPRLTKDLDLWIWMDDGNATAVRRARRALRGLLMVKRSGESSARRLRRCA